MKIIKNVLSVFFMLLLCVLCVACIIYLNTNSQDSVDNISLEQVEKETYSTYSKIFISYMDIEQIVEVEGEIVSRNENVIEDIELYGNVENVLISQGGCFHKGDLVFDGTYKTYYAKYDGRIDRICQYGKKVCLSLSNYQERFICAKVKTEHLKYLLLNDEITFIYGDDEKKGVISYISTTVSEGCATIEVSFEDVDMAMLTYSPVTIQIVKAKAESVLAVPKTALVKSNSDYYVRVEGDNGQIEIVQVDIGLESNDGYIEIKSGLTEDDVVLVDASENVKTSKIDSEVNAEG